MARISDYRFGRIEIDGVAFTRDVIVLPDRVVPNWWRRDGHSLWLEDLDAVIDELPTRLVVGAGHDGRLRPQTETIRALEERGVEVLVLPTTDAVRRYAELDPATTAAALHLTC